VLLHIENIGIDLSIAHMQGDAAISIGDFVILKNKRSNAEFAFKVDLCALIQ